MQTFAHYALPATILASAIGGVVLCVILFYGFRSEPDDEGTVPGTRLFAIRLGHALAAACFAAAVMLGTVALIDQQRAIAEARPTDLVRRLEARIRTLEQRVATTEARIAEGVAARARDDANTATAVSLPSRPSRPSATQTRRPPRPAAATRTEGMASPTPQRESSEAAVVPSTTANAPSASAPPPPEASEDLGAKLRRDWEAVKRGFQEAGQDVRSGAISLGRRVKETFTRD